MQIKVIYDISSEDGSLFPYWMMIDQISLEWSKTLHVNIDSPFQRYTFDEVDSTVMAISIPDHVYVRQANNSLSFGLHLPSLKSHISKSLTNFDDYLNVCRLLLRIHDIEEIMQFDVRSFYQWK